MNMPDRLWGRGDGLSRWMRRAFALGAVLALIGIGVARQPYYPKTWQDEGFALQGAMNLARHGQWAMRSAEGFRVLDQPLVANGPGLVLPIAAAFAVFGVGLLQARLVMVVGMVGAAIVFFLLARRLFGAPAAICSTVLLLAVPDEGFILYGRHALGNVPALGWFLLGCLIYSAAGQRRDWRLGALAGLMMGIAAITKAQYILLLPVLATAWGVEWLVYRRLPVASSLALLAAFAACLAGWQLAQWLIVGADNYARHLEALRSSADVTVLAFRLSRVPGNLWYLARSGFALMVLPGLALAAWQVVRRAPVDRAVLLLMAFVAVWTVWYAFVSVGWPRYLFEPYAVGLLLAGRFARDAVACVRRAGVSVAPRPVRRAAAGLLAAMALWAAAGLIGQAARLMAEPNQSPQQFARLLLATVGPDQIVESWEWELDVLADLRYHHPTNDWVDRFTAATQFGETPDAVYDPAQSRPAFLIDGPFSKWTGIYRPALDAGCCALVGRAGQYDLYRFHLPGE